MENLGIEAVVLSACKYCETFNQPIGLSLWPHVSVLTPKLTPKMGDREDDWEQLFEERFLVLFRNQANIHLLWHYNLD